VGRHDRLAALLLDPLQECDQRYSKWLLHHAAHVVRDEALVHELLQVLLLRAQNVNQ